MKAIKSRTKSSIIYKLSKYISENTIGGALVHKRYPTLGRVKILSL
jgi:hypothetical protein